MIQYAKGNMFTNAHQGYVCTVNCVGVMGAGVAKETASRFPDVVAPYQSLCRQQRMTVDHPVWFERDDESGVLMFATKKHWRNPSKSEWIERGLIALESLLSDPEEMGHVKDLAFPPLGCGHGKLNFDRDVRHLMEFYLEDWDGTATIYLPH